MVAKDNDEYIDKVHDIKKNFYYNPEIFKSIHKMDDFFDIQKKQFLTSDNLITLLS